MATFIPGGAEEWKNRRLAIFACLWTFLALLVMNGVAGLLNTSTPLLQTQFVWTMGGILGVLAVYVAGVQISDVIKGGQLLRGQTVTEETNITRTIEPPAAPPAAPATPASP
jgi:nucleoside permease NupC